MFEGAPHRAVITMMFGRLTEHEILDVQAERKNIELFWQDKHWFGIAVFRCAYHMLTDGGYASKKLACSMRAGPVVAGKMRFWDVQKIAGGDIVYTCPSYVLEPLFDIGEDLVFEPEIEKEVPRDVMDKLLKIPYYIQAFDPNGGAGTVQRLPVNSQYSGCILKRLHWFGRLYSRTDDSSSSKREDKINQSSSS